MFFLSKDQVDRDAEKLRQSTLSPEKLNAELEAQARERKRMQENVEDFTWKDVLAMTIAIIQVILPYFVVMISVMVLVFLYFYFMGTR